jgi:ABC-type amino acid transport substrate-binding protein
MVTRVNEILTEMRDDGTLKGFSEKWFGLDLTVKQGG